MVEPTMQRMSKSNVIIEDTLLETLANEDWRELDCGCKHQQGNGRITIIACGEHSLPATNKPKGK